MKTTPEQLDRHVLHSHNFRCGSIETISEDKPMKYTNKELDEILDTPYTFKDCPAENLRMYFYLLLDTLWVEGEGFSGKRPFGSSGWENELYVALITTGAMYGRVDEEKYPWRFDEKKAELLVSRLMMRCTGADKYYDVEV
jgi:hypothetical protein